MILRSLSVRGWRCFPDETRVGPLSDRINVVYGANGTGKSTLFRAMTRGFLDGHRVTGDEAETLRPWGRALAPTVTVEFLHAGSEYRLEKRFLDRPSSQLARNEQGRFVPVAEGDAADEQVRRFLRAKAPGRGLSDNRHWGMAQVLWTLQGDLELKELSGDLANDVRSMLGVQLAGPGGTRVEQRLAAIYGQYYTPSGRVKSGQQTPDAVRLEEAKSRVEQTLRVARGKLDLFESMSRRVEDYRASQEQSHRQADELATALKATREQAKAFEALKAEGARRSERVKATEAEAKALKQRVEDIEACLSEINRAREDYSALTLELPLRSQAVRDAVGATLRLKATLEDVRAGRAEVDSACECANAARQYLDAKEKAAALVLRLNEIHKAESELQQCTIARAALIAPDDAAMRKIRKAVTDQDSAELQLTAAMISLELVPSRDCSVRVISGEVLGTHSVEAGAPGRFTGSPEIVLEVADFGRIRVSGPVGSVSELREQRDAAVSQVKKLTLPFGSSEMDTLETLHERGGGT
jgi:hypothetical protein